jgi:hypothetical protein
MSKRFTLAEAERLLPHIEGLLREAIAAKAEFSEAEEAMQALLHRIMTQGGVLVDRVSAEATKGRREATAGRLKHTLERIQETGCVVKDLDIGLVDFPTLFRGQEVYLCWRLDEPGIRFWHGVHEGFAGRKPIDQDFLENHHGDKPQ